MNNQDVLVPIDFSASSLQALEVAISLARPEGEVYLLHVVDIDFIGRLIDEGFGSRDPVTDRMRQRAEERMKEIAHAHEADAVRVHTMVAVGKPFAEILKLSTEMDFDLIVLARQGWRVGDIEALLFGSTAEKVLRGARIPVLCVPRRSGGRRDPSGVEVA